MPAPPAGSRARTWVGMGVLVLAVAATFGNALDNGFVYDDQLLIVDDPAVRLPLSAGFEGLHYRPLRTLSYRLDYALGGMDPYGFHMSNVIYHGVTVLLVFLMLGAVGASPGASLAGALVFAVHPVQADAVSYAAGRRDVLCGLFYALGVLAYLRYRRGGGAAALVLAAGAYVLAILAKEMAITLPVACVMLDRWQTSQARHDATDALPAATPRRRHVAYLVLLGAIGGLALALTYGRQVMRIATEQPWHGGSIGANLATVARVWMKYLQLVLWPAQLSADYSYDAFPVSTSALDPRALASGAMLVVLGWAGWRSSRRGGRVGLGLLWVAVTLLPVSHLVPFRELLAEHYLYIPMMGVALITSGVVDAAATWWPARRRWLAMATLVVVSSLAARTVVRNRDWSDRISLWSATVAVVPRCARAQYNLGQAYFERNRFAEAERAWLVAAALKPNDHETTRGLAMLYYRLGKHDLAATNIEAVLAARPGDTDAMMLAGWMALDRGKPARALEYFDAALAILPPAKAEKAWSGRARAVIAAGGRPVQAQDAAGQAEPR